MAVDLIVPLKEPSKGKSRLRDGLGCPVSDHRHAELVLAFAFDTLRAATATPGVRRVLVVSSVPAALTALRELGVDVVGEHADDTGDIGNDSDSDDDGDDSDGSDSDDGAPSGRNGAGNGAAGPVGTTDGADAANTGLNAALRTGERVLRATDPGCVIGALQADLPALRPDELAAALAAADGRRAFTADRHGSGTTLLLSAPGQRLDPHFGPGSARAHALSGALPLSAPLPSLRTDVDTPGDLEHARLLGLGERTRTVLDRVCLPS